MEPQSSFAFLVLVNEAFGYTHQQTLDSSLCIIMSMLSEYNFFMNQRNKALDNKDKNEVSDNNSEEWVTLVDFETGQPKKVKKVKSI